MSLTLCWPSWEQIHYIWPSGLSNIFHLGLWPECGLAHTSLPTPPSFYLHLCTGRLSSLTAPETPQCGGPSTTGLCRWQLALHWPRWGWEDSCSLPSGHPQWPLWGISLQLHPSASRTSPWPLGHSEMPEASPCSTADSPSLGSIESPQSWKFSCKSLLPSQQQSMH